MLYGFLYGMASASIGRNRLAKVVPVRKWSWKYHKDSYMNAFVHFYPTPAKLVSTHPNTNCLAALNDACAKRSTAWFRLLLFKNEVNNNSQTWLLVHLTSLVATFYSKFCLWSHGELCLWKNNYNNIEWWKNEIFKQGIGIAEKS